MSRVVIALSSGHTATIEFSGDDLTPFLLGQGPLPEHPDEQASRTMHEILNEMVDDDGVHTFGVKVIGIHMVTAQEQAEEYAKGYRDMAARFLRDQESEG